MCVGLGGGAHHKNQLNVLPFSTVENDILHIIVPSHIQRMHL